MFKKVLIKIKLMIDVYLNFRKRKRYKSLFKKYKEFSMIPGEIFIDNLALCDKYRDMSGLIVECGVWRGGMIAAMAELLGDQNYYLLFDSFEGLPPTQEIDGPGATAWQKDKNSPIYFNNCKAEVSYAEKAMKMSGVKTYQLIKGWFSETLPLFHHKEKIILLRLDGDWYESTMDCLTNLYPKVKQGGIIIIDDYYMWDGCSKAVHDYFSQNKLVAKIRQSKLGVCYIIKG